MEMNKPIPALDSPRDPVSDPDDALARRLAFIVEADRLKGVIRRTRLLDGSRHENSAEHSWHLALMAVVLADAAGVPVDLVRVLTLLLVHDVVEIDAGDTFAFDVAGNLDKEDRERLAAERLFGLLPGAEGARLREAWEEFEAGETPEAAFAVALDRLQPLLLNYHGGGGTWREHGVLRAQVLKRMEPIRRGAPALWPFVERTIDLACRAGYIAADAPTDDPAA
jgi:putative hydrolases of HD superfamily